MMSRWRAAVSQHASYCVEGSMTIRAGPTSHVARSVCLKAHFVRSTLFTKRSPVFCAGGTSRSGAISKSPSALGGFTACVGFRSTRALRGSLYGGSLVPFSGLRSVDGRSASPCLLPHWTRMKLQFYSSYWRWETMRRFTLHWCGSRTGAALHRAQEEYAVSFALLLMGSEHCIQLPAAFEGSAPTLTGVQ